MYCISSIMPDLFYYNWSPIYFLFLENFEMPEMANLTKLTLSGLGLVTLPASVGNQTTALQIDLSSNRMATPTFTGAWSSLVKLSLSNNDIAGSFGR